MNCDFFAPYYEFCERAAFGKRLDRHRSAYLDVAKHATAALVLGDGDGRFTFALASQYPGLQIDYIDLSSRMLALAKRRLTNEQRKRVAFYQDDALAMHFPRTRYDLVYSHFFLDCFSSNQVSSLAGRVAQATVTYWVITDFRQAARGWRRMFTTLWIKTMYIFFGLVTRLQTRHLPQHSTVLPAHGFRLAAEQTSMGGLVASECWRREG